MIHPDTKKYNQNLEAAAKKIANLLAKEISTALPEAENKVWHAHPVWFLDGNPVAGYSQLKDCIRLLFWSGDSFEEPTLTKVGKFPSAEARYTSVKEVNLDELARWLSKSREIQWDFKNIVKRKGRLERLK